MTVQSIVILVFKRHLYETWKGCNHKADTHIAVSLKAFLNWAEHMYMSSSVCWKYSSSRLRS